MKSVSPVTPFFRRPGRATLAAAAIIVAAAWAAFANSFAGAFVFDDAQSIAENPTIRQLWPLRIPLAPPDAVGVGGRPFLNLTYALNFAVGGLTVGSYHALNLLIHLAAGLALFGIVRRTLARRESRAASATGVETAGFGPNSPGLLALAVAVLWTVHPLQTAAVTYLSQRAESLMGLFYLLTLYCFIRGVESGGVGPAFARGARASAGEKAARRISFLWYGASWLACLFGMATKEVMATAPVLVFLYDRTFLAGGFREAWRRHGRLHLALAGTWILLAALWLTSAPQTRGVGFGYGVSAGAYALTESGVIWRYLGLAAWPHPLVLDYDLPTATRLAAALPALLGILLLLAAALRLFLGRPFRDRGGRGRTAVGFLGCTFFLLLAPTSSVVPVAAQAMAENRMYLPLAAVLLLAVLGIRAAAGRLSWAVYLAFALAWGGLTVRRNEQYRSELGLWTETVRERPDNPRARYLLANSLLRGGRGPEAIAQDEAAVRLNPAFPEAWNALGFALAGAGRLPEAIDRYERALRLRPDFPDAAYNLGNALAQAGRASQAIPRYETALRERPGFWQAEENLGSALLNTGRPQEAAARYAAALRLRPGDADLHYDLGVALRALGRADEARAQFEAAQRLGGHP